MPTSSRSTAFKPSLLHEQDLARQGLVRVAGVDEAGRGPLAGPVVVAAVVLTKGKLPCGINDSKALSPATREVLFDEIMATSDVAVVSACASTIDRLNIRAATLAAMMKAANALAEPADHILIDGRDVPAGLIGRATALVKGDSKSLSIAAASICAKVVRDRMMVSADQVFPGYGFADHKGYGTATHRLALKELGATPIHRRSFAPLKNWLT